MKMTSKIDKAKSLGAAAFENGLDRLPTLDPELKKLLDHVEVEDMFPILRAWLRHWDLANLAAPIES